jgi:hypothetical protein
MICTDYHRCPRRHHIPGLLSAEKVNTDIPDRLTAINTLVELKQLAPTRPWNLIEVNITLSELEEAKTNVMDLIAPAKTIMDFNIGSILVGTYSVTHLLAYLLNFLLAC